MSAPNYALHTAYARPTMRLFADGSNEWAVDRYNGRRQWNSTDLGLTKAEAVRLAAKLRRRARRRT